eukprot:9011546-Pyramimonas_sp.AAC.1
MGLPESVRWWLRCLGHCHDCRAPPPWSPAGSGDQEAQSVRLGCDFPGGGWHSARWTSWRSL